MYDDEIEKAVLFYIIFQQEECVIYEEDFMNDRNKKIATAINELKKEKKEISMLSVKAKIKANQSQVLEYLSKIGDNIYGTSFETVYKKLKDMTKKRKIIQIVKESLKDVQEEDPDISSQKIIKRLNEAVNDEEKEKELQEQIIDTLDTIEKNWKTRDDYSLYTGIIDLDKKTCGLHNQELTIIGARPGVGKTTLALQIAQKVARNKKNVLFISLEMSETQLLQKMISRETGINSYKMRLGTLEDKDFEKITQAAGDLSEMSLKINTKIRNVQQIEVLCRKSKNKNNLDLVVIDYIQLLKSGSKADVREQEVAEISRRLKLLSLELEIPIVALCQLNRNASTGEPTLADLRESGSLEQDADNIWLLYQENKENPDVITINIAKQRAGETGKTEVLFDKKTSMFKNIVRG